MKQYTGTGYTIYKHTNKITGKVYIGQTKCKDLTRRWSGGHGYKACRYFFSAIVRYGWLNFDHEILETGLSKSEADEKERFYISKYRSTNPRYGYNIRSGGSDSNEFSKAGYTSLAKLKGNTGCAVVVFDADGRRLREFDTMKAAQSFLGCNTPCISRACRLGKGTVMGYIVRFAEEVVGVSQLPESDIWKPHQQPGKKTPVAMYDTSGQYIRSFDSVQEAANEVGCRPQNIFACITQHRKQKRAGGYMWRQIVAGKYDLDIPPFFQEKRSPPNRVPVCQYDRFTGEKIATFPSYADAAASCNCRLEAIRNCAVGKTRTSGGYIWRLESEEVECVEPIPIRGGRWDRCVESA